MIHLFIKQLEWQHIVP